MSNLVSSNSVSLSDTGPALGPSADTASQCGSHLPCNEEDSKHYKAASVFWHSLFLVNLRSALGGDPKALSDLSLSRSLLQGMLSTSLFVFGMFVLE